MEFHKILDEIIKTHNIKAADICSSLGLKKSYFSRIRNGTLSLPDFRMIDKLSDFIGLSPDEYSRLAYAYQAEKADVKYDTACSAFKKLYAFDPFRQYDFCFEEADIALENGSFISEESFQDAIIHIVSRAENNVSMFCSPFEGKTAEKIAFLLENRDISADWLIPLEKSSRSSQANMEMFVNAFPLIFTGKAAVKGVGTESCDALGTAVFPYYIMNADELLLIDHKKTSGLFIKNADVIKMYQERFSYLFGKTPDLVQIKTDLADFFGSYEKMLNFGSTSDDTEIFIIENNPCILFDIELSDIMANIADINDSRKIAVKYLEFLANGFYNVKKTYNIFSKNGLDHIINDDEYYELDKNLTKSIPKEFRRGVLEKMAQYSVSSDNYLPLIVRLPIFDKTYIRTVNMWSDGKMLLLYTIENRFCILMLNEKSIVSAFVDYYKALIKCGLIKSKEETLEDISAALEL